MTSSRYKIKQTPSKITLSAKIIRNRLKLLLTCRDLVIVLLILANIPNLNFESAFNIILLIFLVCFLSNVFMTYCGNFLDKNIFMFKMEYFHTSSRCLDWEKVKNFHS